MENIEIMLALLAIVIVGYVAARLGYMGGDFDKRLSSLVINFTCPALILSSTMDGQLPDRRFILPLLGISILSYALLTGIAFWLPRFLTKQKDDEGIIGFAIMFGNVGFIGYPIVASIFGNHAVFYAATLNVINTFTVFTVGVMLIQGERGRVRLSRKALYSSPMISAYLAILIVALGIDNVPQVISKPLTMIGNITVPAALLIIGSSMSDLSARALLGNRVVYVTTLLRLVLVPFALYQLFTFAGFDPLVVSINTIVLAMPVATYGTILCLKHGRDTALMVEITFVTTLLSVITIPILAHVFQ